MLTLQILSSIAGILTPFIVVGASYILSRKLESIKADYDITKHKTKELFNKEYAKLEKVWELAWELHTCGSQLSAAYFFDPGDKTEEQKTDFRDKVNTDRMKQFDKAIKAFNTGVIKQRPFIPSTLYEQAMAINKLTVAFEFNFDYPSENRWGNSIKLSKQSNELIEILNDRIRDYLKP